MYRIETTARFEQKKRQIEPQTERLERALRGIYSVLEHDPRVGEPSRVPGQGVWTIFASLFLGLQDVMVCYTIDEGAGVVTLHAIVPTDPDPFGSPGGAPRM